MRARPYQTKTERATIKEKKNEAKRKENKHPRRRWMTGYGMDCAEQKEGKERKSERRKEEEDLTGGSDYYRNKGVENGERGE